MTIKYYDVSHYNTTFQPSGPTCAKATEGSTYTDPRFSYYRSTCASHGYPFLPYHFLRHGNIASQVAHCLSVVSKGTSLMLDVETASDGSVATLADVYAFMDAYNAASAGMVSLVYLPEWYWRSKLGHPILSGITARGAGLISSYYNVTAYTDNGPGWNNYLTTSAGISYTGGVIPSVWQYTDSPVDTNAFKGTQAELGQLWTFGVTKPGNPSVPVQEPDMPLTQADADLVAGTTLAHLLGNTGPTVAVALQSGYNTGKDTNADVATLATKLDALATALAALATKLDAALTAPTVTGTYNTSGTVTITHIDQ